jgi:DNA-binding MarR family transcriptional regulator
MAAPDELLKLDDFLCFAIYSAGHAFTRLYKPLLDAVGLTYPQYLVMVVLWERDGRTVSQIGERLLLESSTLTPLLKRLEGAALIRRSRDRKDERQVRVHLTASGRALKAKAAAIPPAIGCAANLTANGIRKLTSDLRALRAKLLAASA